MRSIWPFYLFPVYIFTCFPCVSFAQVNLTKGLVAYYPFSGNANDASGNGHNGSVNNATLTTDRFGNANCAYSFNGSVGITVPTLSNTGTSGATLSLWVKTTTTVSAVQLVQGVPGVIYLNLFTSGHYLGVFDGSGGNNSASNESKTSINSGSWYNIITKNDGKTSYVYVNGKLENSYSETLWTGSENFVIAQYNAGYGTGYNGLLDDIRVYYRAISDSEAMAIFQMPNVAFGYKTTCASDSVLFADSSIEATGSTYLWNFGDNSTSNKMNPSHFYSKSGTYKVTLKITSPYNSSDTVSRFVKVYDIPVSSFTVNDSIQCVNNNQFDFFNNSSGTGTLSYKWDFGDGYSSTSASLAHSYSNVGTYRVQLQVTNQNGCSNTISKKMIVSKIAPQFSVNTASQCLSGNSFDFTNSSSGGGTLSSLWDFGDGNSSAATNPVYSYSNPGTYTVKLSVFSGNSCMDTVSKKVTIYPDPLPILSINNNTQCLVPQKFLFTGASVPSSGKIVSWNWNFGDKALGIVIYR